MLLELKPNNRKAAEGRGRDQGARARRACVAFSATVAVAAELAPALSTPRGRLARQLADTWSKTAKASNILLLI
mgnify:CR=1 FL=1